MLTPEVIEVWIKRKRRNDNSIILDIGNYDGIRAISFSYNKSNKVISYDIFNRIPTNHKIYTKLLW